jgi:hypothetical protein
MKSNQLLRRYTDLGFASNFFVIQFVIENNYDIQISSITVYAPKQT